jgi:hypothetical protein
MRHLSEEELIDLADGTRPESALPHVAECEACHRQMQDLRAAMAAAIEVEVPEPSPLFWDHLSARVRAAVASEKGSPAGTATWLSWRLALPAGALAALVVAVLVGLRFPSNRPADRPPEDVAGQPTDSGTFGPMADDPSLNLIADLAAELDLDAAAEAGLTMRAGTVDGVVLEMSADERLELQRILKQEMAGQGA